MPSRELVLSKHFLNKSYFFLVSYIQSDYNVRKLASTISNGKMSPCVLVEVWVVRNAKPLKYVPVLYATIDCNVLVVKIGQVSTKHS